MQRVATVIVQIEKSGKEDFSARIKTLNIIRVPQMGSALADQS